MRGGNKDNVLFKTVRMGWADDKSMAGLIWMGTLESVKREWEGHQKCIKVNWLPMFPFHFSNSGPEGINFI
jgi:hypothetical protein